MDLDELKARLAALERMGYVPSMRRGNTGIGYTLETMLGVRENNLHTPDFGDMELKAHRRGASSRITLFTFNRGAWKTPQADAIRKYGCIDTNGGHSLYCLASPRPTTKAFTLGSGTMAHPFAMRTAHSSPNGAGRRLAIDLRTRLRPNGAARNHGAGFRIEEQRLSLCFGSGEGLI